MDSQPESKMMSNKHLPSYQTINSTQGNLNTPKLANQFNTPLIVDQFFSPGNKNQSKLIKDYYQSCSLGTGTLKKNDKKLSQTVNAEANGPDYSHYKTGTISQGLFSPNILNGGIENAQYFANVGQFNAGNSQSMMLHGNNAPNFLFLSTQKGNQKPQLKIQEAKPSQYMKSSLTQDELQRLLRKSNESQKPINQSNVLSSNKTKNSNHNRTMEVHKTKTFTQKKKSNCKEETGLRCGNCGAGPLILMNNNNERLFSETEIKAMRKELDLELTTLNQLRDQQSLNIQNRDNEISKLFLDKRLLEEEKGALEGQVQSITQKCLESLEFQQVMFSMCETLQNKLLEKTVNENKTLEQMEVLMDKVRTSNEFAVESRTNIESLQREVGKLTMLLQEQTEKNHELITEINQNHDTRKFQDAHIFENKALRQELASIKAELDISRHQNQNLRYRTKEQEAHFKQQEDFLKSKFDLERLNSLIKFQEQMPIEKQQQFLIEDNLLLTHEESYSQASFDENLIAEMDKDQKKRINQQ